MASDPNNGKPSESSLTTWSDFLEQHGEPENDPADDEPIETDHSSLVGFRFKRGEMGIYGKYPSSETLQLVECQKCHQFILLQAFRSHFVIRHMQVCPNPKSQVSGLRQPSSSRVRKHSDDVPVPVKSSRRHSVASAQPRSLAAKLESKGYIVDEQVTVVESGNRNERIRMKSPVMSRLIVHNNSVYSGKVGERSRQKGSTPHVKRKSALPPPNMQQVRSLGYDPNRHCGVWMSDQKKHCLRSLTCKTHGLGLRRAVAGRAKLFDILLAEHRFRSNQLKEEETKSIERDLQPSSRHNHVMESPSSPTKKSASKRELRTPVSTVSDVGASLGNLLDKVLEKDELAVSLSQPQPAALLDFGGVRLGSGHVMFGSLEDRMRSHLVQLQHRDLRPTARPSNLGKPLDLHEDKSQHRVNTPALLHHPLPVHNQSTHSDGSQTPQPSNEWTTTATTDSSLYNTNITNGFDQAIMTSQGDAMNCQLRQTEAQRKGHVSGWPIDSTGCVAQFQLNRQMNGDVSLEQLQSSLVASAYPMPNGLLAPMIDMQQIIVKQPGKPGDARGVTNASIPRQTNPSLNHTINRTAVIPNQPLSPGSLSAQYHTQLLQQQQLQLQLLQGNHMDPQQQLLPSQHAQQLCLTHFTQTVPSILLQQHVRQTVMKPNTPRKPGKLDLSAKHHMSKPDSITSTDLSSFSLPVAMEASTDSYHLQSPLMHVTPIPSLPSPASIAPSTTLVQCPDLLSTAIPPGSQ